MYVILKNNFFYKKSLTLFFTLINFISTLLGRVLILFMLIRNMHSDLVIKKNSYQRIININVKFLIKEDV